MTEKDSNGNPIERRCPNCDNWQDGSNMHPGVNVYWHRDGSPDACAPKIKPEGCEKTTA